MNDNEKKRARAPSATVRGHDEVPRTGAVRYPVPRTPGKGLPAAPRERGLVLVELARADLARGNFISAETNFRLALSWLPDEPDIQAELKIAVAKRLEQWRNGGGGLGV